MGVIPLDVRHGLPFVQMTVAYGGASLRLDHVLLDTGSASTVLATDRVAEIGLLPQLTDRLRLIAGIGGSELVVDSVIPAVTLAGVVVTQFPVELASLEHGILLDGIIGFDLLSATGAVVDLKALTLRTR
jgi:predicted aspartyl protease